MPFGERNFDFGVNMPWLNGATGHDLGRYPYFPSWDVCWSEDVVRAYFADLSSKGLKVVRVWAFEQLEGLQFDSSSFNPAQIVSRSTRDGHSVTIDNFDNYETWNIPSVRNDPDGLGLEFRANVRRLMQLAADAELEIYWTILSSANYFKNPSGHHQWALKRMLENARYRRRFIENAMRPFLQILQEFRDNVYAIDLINEPEGFYFWDVSIAAFMITHIPIRTPNIPRDVLEDYVLDYIREASDEVRSNAGDFKVSVGFRSKTTIEDNLGALDSKLDFFDFHHYDTDSLSEGPFPDKPTILGEIGYMSTFGSFMPDDDDEQREAVDGIIRDSIDRVFRGCLVWMYTPYSTGEDTNNLLNPRDGNNACAADATAAFVSAFTSNPNDHWRTPVREAIAARRLQIDGLNSGP